MSLTKISLSDFARWLDGRAYGSEITKEEERIAKELGFVVVFGYSDDNAELRGAIDDEIGCFDGGILKHKGLPDTIRAVWWDDDAACPWTYRTNIPHEQFRIYEGGDLYCVGIVCDINISKDANGLRLIDANTLKAKAFPDPDSGEGMVYVQDIDEAPTVDAAPVVHGQWKYGTRAAVCSECGFERHLDDNFGAAIACPNCGARMDGGSSNG